MSDNPQNISGAEAIDWDDEELVDLTPTMKPEAAAAAAPAPKKSRKVALVAGNAPSLNTETNSLLQTRLRALVNFILFANVLLLGITFFGSDYQLFGSHDHYLTVSIIQVLFLCFLCGVLYSQHDHAHSSLKMVEYALFFGQTMFWIFDRFFAVVKDAASGDYTDLLVDDRESAIPLILLMVVYGMFIPNNWRAAARVVIPMAMAPVVALTLVTVLHPELQDRVSLITAPSRLGPLYVLLFLVVILSLYGASVTNKMRQEVHKAKKFGQYQLQTQIGKGGMGEVHLAEHELLKRPCALKLIRPEAAGDELALARFEREVQTTASLTHPNTIAIYDYGRAQDNSFYYVMEYLPGMSADELIHECGRISPGRTIYLLRQVCSALADAHSAGLIHRDLKPANIFISERGGLCDFVKVLDFGLVKLTSDPAALQLTGTQVICGTPMYMSPEQALGESGLDARCDIYALGAIAYSMLTGRPPFEGSSPVSIMIAHARDEVKPPREIGVELPEDIEAVVLKCLSKSVDDRYADVIALDQALAACDSAGDWDGQKAAVWWEEFTQKKFQKSAPVTAET